MFISYVKIAIRNLLKNKLYAAINVIGLAIGLALFILSGTITDYERNHDNIFTNRDRIFTVTSVYNPLANQGNVESRGVYLPMASLLRANLPDGIQSVALRLTFETLMQANDNVYYQNIQLVSPDFLKMFDFDFLGGSAAGLTASNQVVLSREMAIKYFATTDVVGEILTITTREGEHSLQVVGVIQDLPADTHFSSQIGADESLGIFGLIDMIDHIEPQLNPETNWNQLSTNFRLYLMTDGIRSRDDLEHSVNEVYFANVPEGKTDFVQSHKVRPLKDANLQIWHSAGIPVIETFRALGILVLVVAIINYTNLAIVQNMARIREVGMRKVLGARRNQLLFQFLVECQCIVFIAVLVSLAIVELVIPVFNDSLGRAVAFDYMELGPMLLVTTVGVGLLAGAYPAYVITQATPSDALKKQVHNVGAGIAFRNIMIGTQFAIAIIMMALVLVVYVQNRLVASTSEIFPKSQILDIQRMENAQIMDRLETLRHEILTLEDVEKVALSSQVPFEQQNWTWFVTKNKGDADRKFEINNMHVSHDFLAVYKIPILAGRDFSEEIGADLTKDGATGANVIINERAVEALGFNSPAEAVGQTFYSVSDTPYMLRIVGVMEDRNILGLQNHIKPFLIRVRALAYRHLNVLLREGASVDTVTRIENIWKRLLPDHPFTWQFLDAQFEEVFSIMRYMNQLIAVFAMVAVSLALIGLFGLAAFLAEQRTREIGIRKVLGASVGNIVPMLLLQFSKPAIWGACLSAPVAYFAAQQYLAYFAERINMTLPLIVGAGVFAVLLSWLIIGVHALRVARRNPIHALRYE